MEKFLILGKEVNLSLKENNKDHLVCELFINPKFFRKKTKKEIELENFFKEEIKLKERFDIIISIYPDKLKDNFYLKITSPDKFYSDSIRNVFVPPGTLHSQKLMDFVEAEIAERMNSELDDQTWVQPLN